MKIKKKVSLVLLLIFAVQAFFADDLEDFRAAYALYKDGFYDVAARAFAETAAHYPASSMYDDMLYYQAIALLKQNKIQEALPPLWKLFDKKDYKYYNDVLYYLSLNNHMLENYSDSEKAVARLLPVEKDLQRREKLLYITIKNNFLLKKNSECFKFAQEYVDTPGFDKYRAEVLRLQTDLYLQEEDYENALIRMDLLLPYNSSPEELSVLRYNYLYALYMTNRDKEAIIFFERGGFAFLQDLYFLMSDIYYRSNQPDKSYGLLDDIYKNTKLEEAVRRQALIDYERDKFGNALSLLENRTNENYLPFFKSDLAYRIGEKEKSLFYIKKIAPEKMTQNELQLYYQLAAELGKTDEYYVFIKQPDLLNKLAKDERNLVLYNLAVFCFNELNYDDAGMLMKRWLAEFSSDERYDSVLYMSGVTLNHLKRYQEAVIEFTKLQKFNKKDRIYYESMVDKGEAYFLLLEYGSAIRSYESYLANNVTSERKKEALIQLGNAYFNIKRYDKAYKNYLKYESEYGHSAVTEQKIAETLLKKKDFSEIQSYFGRKQNTALGKAQFTPYSFFVYLYSCFQREDYQAVTAQKNNLSDYKSSSYYADMLYILVMACQKMQAEDELVAIYENNRLIPDNDSGLKVRKALFKSFLKIRRIDLANELFVKKDNDLLYFLGDAYASALYLDEAAQNFILLLNGNPQNLSYPQLVKIYKVMFSGRKLYAALTAAEYLCKLFPSAVEPQIYRFNALYYLNNIERINQVITDSVKVRDSLFYSFASYSIEYMQNQNAKNYLKDLQSLLDKVDIDKPAVREIVRMIIEISLQTENYKTAASVINKIPSSKMNHLDAEIRYNEAVLYEKSGNQDKAVDLLLKIFYLYPSDVFWVEKSIREVLRIYEERGEAERSSRIIKMFEEKYFRLDK